MGFVLETVLDIFLLALSEDGDKFCVAYEQTVVSVRHLAVSGGKHLQHKPDSPDSTLEPTRWKERTGTSCPLAATNECILAVAFTGTVVVPFLSSGLFWRQHAAGILLAERSPSLARAPRAAGVITKPS